MITSLKHCSFVLIILAVICSKFLVSAQADSKLIDVRIDDLNGNFTVSINSIVWFESGDVFIRSAREKFSVDDRSLKFINYKKSSDKDKFGHFTLFNLKYSTRLGSLFSGIIKVYDNSVVFEQQFESALYNTSSGNADGLISAFPTFKIRDSHGGEGYAHWISWFYESDGVTASPPRREEESVSRRTLVAPGFATPQFGKWNENVNMSGGIGGSGVISVYDSHSTAVVISPLTNPMVASHVCNEKGQISYGVMGNVTTVPKDYKISFIMYVGTEGVNQAVTDWGTLMRTYYNKVDANAAREKDITLQYLGYTTDNGAFYYYHTEENKDYEETLVDVKKYADSLKIPIKYVLLDSWWYYKGSNGGVSNWTALPEIFPRGVEALFNQTGWFVQAHNRYWSLDNHYSKTYGGKYDFIEDSVKDGAVPVSDTFWSDIFETPAKNWGLKVYEQDWLFNEYYQYVSQFLESLTLGRQWLLQMGEGAAKQGLTIQYCMPFIRHLLQSLEVSTVTQARASDDYVVSPYIGVDNWRIGGQSLLIDALGLAPSKDGYWSTGYQPTNPYGEDRFEPYPRLHAVVTALSAGPVAIADGIGYMDAELIMKSCTQDGRLLQPSSPATMIDLQFKHSAAIGDTDIADGEVWFAPSYISSAVHGHSDKRVRFGSLFVADLKTSFDLKPSDVGYPLGSELYVLEANSTTGPVMWSETKPLTLKTCGYGDFSLYSISPIDPLSGWSFLGEKDKWVSVSPARFESVVDDATATQKHGHSFSVMAKGTDGETLNVGFINREGMEVHFHCVVGKSGKVLMRSTGVCEQI